MLTFISVFTPVHIRERRHPGTGQAVNQAPDNNPAACTKKERGKPSVSRSHSPSEITPSRLAFIKFIKSYGDLFTILFL